LIGFVLQDKASLLFYHKEYEVGSATPSMCPCRANNSRHIRIINGNIRYCIGDMFSITSILKSNHIIRLLLINTLSSILKIVGYSFNIFVYFNHNSYTYINNYEIYK
jgi:hypothetical protein